MKSITKTSKELIKAADAAQIHPFQGGPRCLLSVSRNGNVAYVCGSDQDAILFMYPAAARLAIQRFRPDLEPTTIENRA